MSKPTFAFSALYACMYMDILDVLIVYIAP